MKFVRYKSIVAYTHEITTIKYKITWRGLRLCAI